MIRRRRRRRALKVDPQWRRRVQQALSQAKHLRLTLDRLLQEMPAQEARPLGIAKAHDDATRTVETLRKALRGMR